MRLYILIVLASASGLFACNKLNQLQSEISKPGESGQTQVIIPHSVEFKATKSHGTQYLSDQQSCKTCHTSSLASSLAGSFAGNLANSSVNTNSPGGSCLKCHSSYPHPANWALQKNHGAKYVESIHVDKSADKAESVTCSNCHDANRTDKATSRAVACDSCHTMIPHGDGFLDDSTKPGHHSVIARSYDGKCTRCHTDQKRLMPTYGESGGCNTCHGEGMVLRMRWEPAQQVGLNDSKASKFIGRIMKKRSFASSPR